MVEYPSIPDAPDKPPARSPKDPENIKNSFEKGDKISEGKKLSTKEEDMQRLDVVRARKTKLECKSSCLSAKIAKAKSLDLAKEPEGIKKWIADKVNTWQSLVSKYKTRITTYTAIEELILGENDDLDGDDECLACA